MSTDTIAESTPRVLYALPLEPLWKLAMVEADCPATSSAYDSAGFTSSTFAEMVGHAPRSVLRWLAKGTIPLRAADEAAIALGYHPVEVWGYEWLNAKGDLDDIVAGKYDAAIERDLARAEAAIAADLEAEIAAEAMMFSDVDA